MNDPHEIRKQVDMLLSTMSVEEKAGQLTQYWTFAPMVDISRDPRWGRIINGAGEDPYLGVVQYRPVVLLPR
jgi:beta-glucosidase-like glycosyl hydrolase